MADWFIAFNGESLGPISAAELKQRALAGEISPETQICKAGSNKWAPASALKGLFPETVVAGTAQWLPARLETTAPMGRIPEFTGTRY